MVTAIGIAVFAMIVTFILKHFVSKIAFDRKYKLPNVVPGWPLLGNTLDVPYPAGMWGKDMAKKYGEM